MYEISFSATRSAGWAQALEIIDDSTNRPLDVSDLVIELAVKDDGGYPGLKASTEDGTIVRPTASVIQWSFTPDQLRGLCAGRTYKVGCTATDIAGTIQLFVGTLAVIDGVVP